MDLIAAYGSDGSGSSGESDAEARASPGSRRGARSALTRPCGAGLPKSAAVRASVSAREPGPSAARTSAASCAAVSGGTVTAECSGGTTCTGRGGQSPLGRPLGQNKGGDGGSGVGACVASGTGSGTGSGAGSGAGATMVTDSAKQGSTGQLPVVNSHTRNQHDRGVKRKRLPPPPAELQPRNVPPPDDPSKHGGRKRTVPRVRGTWMSLVYVNVDGIRAHRAVVNSVVEDWRHALRAAAPDSTPAGAVHLMHEGGGGSMELHSSISKMFGLRSHQFQPVLEALRRRLALVPAFDAALSGVTVLTNEDKCRTFLALTIEAGYGREEMLALIEAADVVLAKFGHDKFYEDPIPHTSVAWALGDVGSGQGLPSSLPYAVPFRVRQVFCRIGKTVHSIPLASGAGCGSDGGSSSDE